ncbi:filamentous hemagglutinin N-terminal domain-containing protein [Polaromonas sp. DSR2-3-2]|uniref:two-partner secretion domain-containing protein n=1 Tax=unclassified Polaromonas TaxID=2638319 RepID=UPI003CFA292A
MNHHYRIVWSRVSNTWVAVSEVSKGHGKSSSTRKRVVGALAMLGLSALSMAASALDLPAGAQVTAGAATVQTPATGAMLVNQSTQRAVIKWNDFSIGQGKQVTFAQPNASAATLNVVTGGNASAIAGTLKSNGSVYLINQNGIAITPTGLVDTRAGFIASTLRMDESAFMGGKNVFSGKGASVVNRGQILTGPGGTVGLLGSTVANEGLISAPLGKVALGSGEAATLDLSGDGFLQVMLPASALAADGQALVSNSGVIQADGGTIMLKAATVRQALREAVNMPGDISARSVSGKNGAIVLDGGAGGAVRVTGSLIADGDTLGGRIDVTGAKVTLEGASLSATGTERGGLVRVGGAFQGGREQPADSADAVLFAGRFGSTPVIANATTTTIDAASNINVSATGPAGTGGTAIVWSNSTTAMQGAISARGAVSGGAVEVSAKSTVQSVDLKRIDLGQGGKLLIDPQDIVINSTGTDTAKNYNYATPGTVTRLLDADVTALLSAGTTVNLQASQDISWLDNFSFVTRTSATPGGNLNLSAGRSVTLGGVFETGGGNWTIVANDTAAHGVVDAERGAGAAKLDVRNANFINSNGNLSLTLADGAGNTNREVDRITLGKFSGNGLTATILPTATPAYGATQILLTDDINVSGAISLTGNLLVSSMSSVVALSGQSVTWTDEKTGGTIFGEGAIKFIENGLTTHLGKLSYGDAVRLELDSQPGLTRVYGDSDPGLTDLTAPLLRVAAHSGSTSAADPLGDILGAGSLALSGPGVLASAGNNNLSLSATSSAELASGLAGSYFVALGAIPVPLAITQRRVTPAVSNGAYVYGAPVAVAGLSGLVNGDTLAPLATHNGTANVTMVSNGLGFGFDPKVNAGASSFSLTGLSGAGASNYLLDLSGGAVSGMLNIAPKPLNYLAANGGQVYGSAGTLPTASLSGILAGDDVAPLVGLSAAGQAANLSARTPAATYASDVVSLTGTGAGNYTVAATGNTSGRYTVSPKAITVSYDPAGITSTYGDMADLSPGVSLTGVLAGDTVVPDVQNNWLSYRTPAGDYTWTIRGLQGNSSGNYSLSYSGDVGRLTINKKPISYFGVDMSQVYGQATLPSPWFLGVLSADLLGVTASQVVSYPSSYAPSGSGNLPVGSYQVDLGAIRGAFAGNYSLDLSTSTPQKVAITPKPVSVAYMNSLASTYGIQADMSSANPALIGIVSGDIVAGQTYAYDQLRSGDNVNANTPVGTYTVALDALSGADSANYKVADRRQSVGSLQVNPKNVTVQFTNPGSRYVYGDTVDFGGTVDGLVAGDIVSPVLTNKNRDFSPATDPYLNVGSYFRVATALEGPKAWNYRVINSLAPFDITPRQLAFSIAPLTTGYGNPFHDYSAWVSFSNLVGNDKVEAKIGYQYGYRPGASVYLPGNTVMTDRSPAGDYTSVATGLTGPAASNYMLPPAGFGQQIQGSLTILPISIISRFDKVDTVYGTPAVLGLGHLEGVLAGDNVNAGRTTLADGTQPSYLSNAGTYNLRTKDIWGAQSGNYKLSFSVGQLTIQRKVVSLIANGFTWNNTNNFTEATYGTYYRPTGVMSDSEAATYAINFVLKLEGVIQNQDVKHKLVAPDSFRFSKSGAYLPGTYTWNSSGVLTGVDASNYVLSQDTPRSYNLIIKPKEITDAVAVTNSVDRRLFTAVYGTPMGLKALGNADVVTTPFGKDDAVFQPYIKDSNNNKASFIYERQAAGNYNLESSFFGADVSNYATPKNAFAGPFEITRKTIDLSIADNGLVNYGSNALPWVYSGLVPGDTLQAVSFICSGLKCGTAAIAKTNLPFRTSVGYYYATVTELKDLYGRSADNYQWTNAGYPGSQYFPFTIQPLQLTWSQGAGNLSITYGDKLPATNTFSLSGILPGDVVKTGEPIATPISVAVGGTGVRRGVDTLPDAGTYTFGAVAAAGSNYLFPTDGRLTVAPKPLAYAITDVSGQYGNYKACNTKTCDPWIPGIDLGQIIVPGALVGDRLGGTIGLLDLKGGKVSFTDKTPVGNYFQVLTGLTGASAPNYVVASSGSVPGVLSITPMWLSYATSSAVFVGSSGFGLVGKPGVATLRGPNGTPINNDDVKGNVAMVAANGHFVSDAAVEFKNLSSSRYTFPVVGLAGKDAGNYRILPKDHSSEATYGKNDTGTLDVYADTTLNLSTGAYEPPGAATANERLIPALPAYAPNQNDITINGVSPWSPGTSSGTKGITAIAAIGIAKDLASRLTGSQKATAGTSTGTQTSLGEAELSANAKASAEALAQYGITGVKLVASANADAGVRLDFGPGYVNASASTLALVSAKLNPKGLAVLANAGASAQAGVGYSSSTDAGKVTAATTVTANAGASGSANAGYNNGSVGATTSGSVGAGVSVSGTAGLSGDTGSLQSTASVTSPGSLGGSGGGSVGYSDGRLRVSFEFGADIGIGGFKLKLDGDIRPGAVADFVNGDLKNAASAVGGAIGCGLGFGGCPSPPRPPTEEEKYNSKVRFISSLGPAAKYAYLVSIINGSSNGSEGERQADREAATKNSKFVSEFAILVTYANYLKATRENKRRDFLNLLTSDPSQAIALANAGYLDPSTDQRDIAIKFGYSVDSNYEYYASEVKAQAARWKVGITMEDGRMTFRDPKQ